MQRIWPEAPDGWVLNPNPDDWRPTWEWLSEFRTNAWGHMAEEPIDIGEDGWIDQALATLGERDREIVERRAFARDTHRELAADLGYPHRMQVWRAEQAAYRKLTPAVAALTGDSSWDN